MMIFKDFTLQQIDLLSQLSEVSGIRDLARKNNADPGKITRLIQDLEAAIGYSIVIRSKRGIELTSEGRQAVNLARDIVNQFKQIDSLKKLTSEFTDLDVINIGSRGFLTTLLAQSLTRLPIEKTQARFRFLDSSPSDLFKAALAGTIDVAVHLENWSWPGSWISEEVSTITWGLVGNSKHPLPKKIRVAQSQKYPFIGVSYLQNDRIERSEDIFALRWSERKIGHESQTAGTSKIILQNTDHLAFLPLVTVADELHDGRLKLFQVSDMNTVQMKLRMSLNQDRVKNSVYKIMQESVREIKKLDESLSGPLISQKRPVTDKISNRLSL
jgi:DNA-binding transcriptional LysR family regulator